MCIAKKVEVTIKNISVLKKARIYEHWSNEI